MARYEMRVVSYVRTQENFADCLRDEFLELQASSEAPETKVIA